MNKFIGIGNIGDNPEVLTGGCKLSLCTTIYTGKENKNIWLKVFVFGKAAETCLQYLTKGRKIAVEGRVDITKKGNIVIVTDNVTFL